MLIDRILGWLVSGMDTVLGWATDIYESLGLNFLVVVMCMVVASVVINQLVAPMIGSGSSDVARGKKR